MLQDCPADALRVLVVIPAYNEEGSVGSVVQEVRKAVPHATVVVVDDGSTDATGAVARGAGAVVLTLPFNLGVGGAMRAGYLFGKRGDFDAVVQVDADGQHDPVHIPGLVAGLGEANIVIGARFAGVGAYEVRGPRRWAMRMLGASLSRTAGTRLTDTTSGFRAADRRAVGLFARHYPAEYLGDTVESLVMAVRAGLVVRQMPVDMRLRTTGSPSQSAVRAGAYLLRAILALGLARVRRSHVVPANEPSELASPRGGELA